ncbi:glycosyltransferase 87 family protein [Actinacidiphila soli]|uniref:glycosyltransferase 87 family protein n=1 Tax=Actinacidiphila soli TaxID=2487275 RepID=UPI000FCA20B6|nr:glycosyltransferase 87 family protein [Actinacidiphila soli]
MSPGARLPVAATAVVGTALYLVTVPLHRHWFDVGVYYGAIGDWVHGGRLYDYVRPRTPYGFTYPPFAALCMLPMAALSWHGAVVVSIALNAGAGVVVLALTAWPVIRREGWAPAYAGTLAACLLALLEPVRDTLSLGQVNLALLALVLADAYALRTGRRAAGLGIGLAAAVKLTPALFIGYLLLTGRRRAAATAAGTALGATLLTAAVAPQASRTFWTAAMWDTNRVGSLTYVGNQSLRGLLARLDAPGTVWACAVAAVLAVWALRARRAYAAGDDVAGFALTGIAACLVSPVTWVHHLVWLIPSLTVTVDAALRSRPRRWPAAATASYLLLSSSMIWLWLDDTGGIDGFLGGNAYVWLSLALLVKLPVRQEEGSAATVTPHHPAGASPRARR